MMFKVLCFVLIAAAFVEASPRLFDENGNLIPLGERLKQGGQVINGWYTDLTEAKDRVANKLGESFHNAVEDNKVAIKKGIDATVNAAQAFINASEKVIEAKIAAVTTPPKIVYDAVRKLVNDST